MLFNPALMRHLAQDKGGPSKGGFLNSMLSSYTDIHMYICIYVYTHIYIYIYIYICVMESMVCVYK